MVDKEKQIEIPADEMGSSGYSKLAWAIWNNTGVPMVQCVTIDRIVREQGYRKQSEGEWIETSSNDTWYYDCPFCDDGYATKGRDVFPPNHCSNCGAKLSGAKMKGV